MPLHHLILLRTPPSNPCLLYCVSRFVSSPKTALYYIFESNDTTRVNLFSEDSPFILDPCGFGDFSLLTVVPIASYTPSAAGMHIQSSQFDEGEEGERETGGRRRDGVSVSAASRVLPDPGNDKNRASKKTPEYKYWTFQGEQSKWVGVSATRFSSISPLPVPSSDKPRGEGSVDSVVVHLEVVANGVPGEAISVGFIDPSGAVHSVACVFGATTVLRITSTGLCK